MLDEQSRGLLLSFVDRIRSTGVDVLTRADHPLIETLELSVRAARRFGGRITAWENRWAQRNLIDEHPDGVSERAQRIVRMAEQMTPDDYREALLEREIAQAAHARLAGVVDAMVTLSCPGPAHEWHGDRPGEPLAPRPTGDAVFNMPSSVLFAPAVSTPMLAIDGMPVGVQFMGQRDCDADVVAIVRWAIDTLPPMAL